MMEERKVTPPGGRGEPSLTSSGIKPQAASSGVKHQQSTELTDEDRARILAQFRARGGFTTSPKHFISRVLEEEEGRTESIIERAELIDAFRDHGFTVVRAEPKATILAIKLSSGAIRAVKVSEGKKRRIVWKTLR